MDDHMTAETPGLARARRVATLFDDSLRIPGTSIRIGIDPLLGVLPVSGDLVSATASLYILAEAVRADVPRTTLAKMVGLVAVDVLVGAIPVVGVLVDAVWKANRWNVSMLEAHVSGE